MQEKASKQAGTKRLSTEPYKGVRDFYPKDAFLQNYLFTTMRSVAERFGYEEYAASLLEPAELYAAKSSEEIVNEQTYTFEDRGKRPVTLRPEMTPSVARMVAAKRRELAFPLRWYSIPNVFRYERPQRGRLREHWQLNCDIFGVPGIEADVEIMALAHAIMREFGAQDKDFEIRIASRKTLSAQCSAWGLTNEQTAAFMHLLDRKDKIDDFEERTKKISADIPLPIAFEADADVTRALEQLNELGIGNAHFDPSLVRGFEYYTGMVFEVFATDPHNRRSLFGGGRYDNLLDIFGHEPLPAVGFGMGDVTMRDFLETHNLMPYYRSVTDLYLCPLTPTHTAHAQQLAARLRLKDINAAVHLGEKKLGDQIKIADKKSIPFVLIVGDDEINSGEYTLKELATGREQRVREDEIATAIFESET